MGFDGVYGLWFRFVGTGSGWGMSKRGSEVMVQCGTVTNDASLRVLTGAGFWTLGLHTKYSTSDQLVVGNIPSSLHRRQKIIASIHSDSYKKAHICFLPDRYLYFRSPHHPTFLLHHSHQWRTIAQWFLAGISPLWVLARTKTAMAAIVSTATPVR